MVVGHPTVPGVGGEVTRYDGVGVALVPNW